MHWANKRWIVEASYRTVDGPTFERHYIEELSELEPIIERGPDWNALIDCRITLNRRTQSQDFTIEQAAVT
jgi:hypothetical protein